MKLVNYLENNKVVKTYINAMLIITLSIVFLSAIIVIESILIDFLIRKEPTVDSSLTFIQIVINTTLTAFLAYIAYQNHKINKEQMVQNKNKAMMNDIYQINELSRDVIVLQMCINRNDSKAKGLYNKIKDYRYNEWENPPFSLFNAISGIVLIELYFEKQIPKECGTIEKLGEDVIKKLEVLGKEIAKVERIYSDEKRLWDNENKALV